MRRVAALLALLLCGTAQAAEPPAAVTLSSAAREAAGLEIRTARAGTLAPKLEAMGTVMAEASRVVTIHPAGSGKVLSVAAVPGQHVRRGDVLLTYQNHSLHLVRLEMAKARAALATARAEAANAQDAYTRARALSGATVSVGETKRRLAALRAARDGVTAREADIGTLEHELDEEFNSVTESDRNQAAPTDETSAVIAPETGEVRDMRVGVADDVSPATALLTLADLSSVWIASDILPQDAARVAEGGAQVTILPQGRAVTSTVLSVGDLADPATGLVRVIASADNREGLLRPGLFLDTRLPTRERVPGVIVPAEAVIGIDGADTVFVPAPDGGFRARAVTVGAEEGGEKVLTAGLAAGERYVARGAFALKSAMLVSGAGGD